MTPDLPEGLLAVHLGHSLVHEDHVILILKRQLHGLSSAAGGINAHQCILEEFRGDK